MNTEKPCTDKNEKTYQPEEVESCDLVPPRFDSQDFIKCVEEKDILSQQKFNPNTEQAKVQNKEQIAMSGQREYPAS
jgi:hypothetical protein